MADNTPQQVTVVSFDKFETYTLNGVVFDVDTALAKFYGDAESIPGDIAVSLGGRACEDRTTALRGGDTILITNRQVERAGFKAGSC